MSNFNDKTVRIHQLTKDVYDLIAAGEVVTGPISVIKELVENSIDAGALHISVEIRDGGRSFMRVTDDGVGIEAADIDLALTAHATSKISEAGDLSDIETLGFRGEALASVCAVSKLELISKTADANTAIFIGAAAGEITEERPVGAPDGTQITVRDLFYNTPARLKFLKSDRSETSKIVDFVSRTAACYPDIAFKLSVADNVLFSTNGSGDTLRAIMTVYGPDIGEGLIPVESCGIRAYISGAGKSSKTRKSQVFFVNGRYVRDNVLRDAVAEAYREYVTEGRHPAVFLFLTVNPESVDVNVHPAKSEIRFYEPMAVADLVKTAIREALASKAGVPKATSRRQLIGAKRAERAFYALPDDSKGSQSAGAEDMEIDGSTGEYSDVVHIEKLWSTNLSNICNSGSSNQDELIGVQRVAEEINPEYTAGKQEEMDIEYLTLIDSIFGAYLLACDKDSLYLIDQHAAHERINYELMLKNMRKQSGEGQTLLTPYVMQVAAPLIPFISERVLILQKLGFEAEMFGGSSVIIRSVPVFLTPGEAEVFAGDVIESDAKDGLSSDRALEKLIARACRKSVKAGEKLEPEEARELLSRLSACENPYTCPHGRPVFIRLTKYDIEKMFGRT